MPETTIEKPRRTLTMRIMDHTGDTKRIWNIEDEIEVADARRSFTDFRKKGYLCYRVAGKGGAKGDMMTEFDANAGAMIVTPPMVGG